MALLPVGIRFIISFSRDQWYRAFIFMLTFLLYASFHLSRKPISIVKGELHKQCTAGDGPESPFSDPSSSTRHGPTHWLLNNETDCGWAPFDKNNYQQLLGALDYAFLCAYAIGMYLSGIIGERLPIRYYLTFGMLASGAFTALFGLGYFYNIHSLGFYVVTQIINGLVQTTGWPSVVTCLSNWFGKGRRGLIMGIWNSHTSVGNILGSLIAGYWVSTCWGLSFIVPGAIVAAMGIVCFLFLIEHPKDVKCSSTLPTHPRASENGINRFRLQKQTTYSEKNGPLDPELQCLLLSDGKNPLHPSHIVVLPADGNMAAISFTGALRIPGVIEFSLCLLFAKLVSYTFLFWLPLYITSVDHLDAKKAGELSTLFDVGGIFGGILAGVISDRLEKRASTCGLMLLLAAPTLYVFSSVSRMGLEATIAMLLLSGALVSGPYALITTAVSADLGTHKSLKGNSHALSTVTAIIDGTGSVGASNLKLHANEQWDLLTFPKVRAATALSAHGILQALYPQGVVLTGLRDERRKLFSWLSCLNVSTSSSAPLGSSSPSKPSAWMSSEGSPTPGMKTAAADRMRSPENMSAGTPDPICCRLPNPSHSHGQAITLTIGESPRVPGACILAGHVFHLVDLCSPPLLPGRVSSPYNILHPN